LCDHEKWVKNRQSNRKCMNHFYSKKYFFFIIFFLWFFKNDIHLTFYIEYINNFHSWLIGIQTYRANIWNGTLLLLLGRVLAGVLTLFLKLLPLFRKLLLLLLLMLVSRGWLVLSTLATNPLSSAVYVTLLTVVPSYSVEW
jgi:hypothetical protein